MLLNSIWAMKKLFVLIAFAAIFSPAFSQSGNVQEKVVDVKAVIDEQLPDLLEFMEKLEVAKMELEERLIVLKYHQTNKEVIEASYAVLDRVGDYYKACMTRVAEFESAWFDQTRNIIDVYTEYGKLKESSGEGNELQQFADDHSRFLDQLDAVKNLLIAVDVDMSDIRNKI